MLILPHEKKIWLNTIFISISIFVFLLSTEGRELGFTNPRSINRVISYTALILLILSMAMSSISYFWDFADRQIIYRKQFGIIGFVYAAIHMGISMYFGLQRGSFAEVFLGEERLVAFSAGLTAIFILLVMTIISDTRIIKKLGGRVWRNLLRLGYVAIFAIVVHMAWYRWEEWQDWFSGQSDQLFPHVTLLLLFLALITIILRVVMEIDMKWQGIKSKTHK